MHSMDQVARGGGEEERRERKGRSREVGGWEGVARAAAESRGAGRERREKKKKNVLELYIPYYCFGK